MSTDFISVELPRAEEFNYWKTSRSSVDTWIDRTEALIVSFGGEVVRRAMGRDRKYEALMLEFEFGPDRFRIVWPVLDSATGDITAARRQAVTAVYHDVKSRAVRFKLFGARGAFFEYLLLPGGTTAFEAGARELVARMPKLLTA